MSLKQHHNVTRNMKLSNRDLGVVSCKDQTLYQLRRFVILVNDVCEGILFDCLLYVDEYTENNLHEIMLGIVY